MKNGLYDLEKNLETELTNLPETGISKKNVQLIQGFHKHNLMRDLSVSRCLKYVNTLKIVALKIKKDFDKAKAEDYEDFMIYLKNLNLSPYTVGTYRAVLKTFHKWLNGGQEYPLCVKWLNGNYKGKKKLPEDMLTQEEVKEMLKHALNYRDKALISVLWESGARISEVGNLKIKDITFDEFGCSIMVNGKTGMRRVRLVNSTPDLLEWLNKHPRNNNREEFVWANIEKNRLGQMGHRYIMKMLQVTANRAGIQKPVNPHHFRHSRATYMAQHLTEAQMKEYFGWTQDSKMAAQYVHLSGKQVDDAILRMHGLVKEERKEDILKRTTCPRCKEPNDVNSQHCSKCWLPLTQTAAIEAEQKKEKDQKAMVALLKLMEAFGNDPEKLAKTIQTIQGGM